MKKKLFSLVALLLALLFVPQPVDAASSVKVIATITYEVSGNGKIGSELQYTYKINGKEVGRRTEMELTSGSKLSLYAKVVELDDIDDVGTGKLEYTLTSTDLDNIKNGKPLKKHIDVTVKENNGRYKGQFRVFRIYFTFEKDSKLGDQTVDPVNTSKASSGGGKSSSSKSGSKSSPKTLNPFVFIAVTTSPIWGIPVLGIILCAIERVNEWKEKRKKQ